MTEKKLKHMKIGETLHITPWTVHLVNGRPMINTELSGCVEVPELPTTVTANIKRAEQGFNAFFSSSDYQRHFTEKPTSLVALTPEQIERYGYADVQMIVDGVSIEYKTTRPTRIIALDWWRVAGAVEAGLCVVRGTDDKPIAAITQVGRVYYKDDPAGDYDLTYPIGEFEVEWLD